MRGLRFLSLLAWLPFIVNAQPTAIVRDGFSDAAADWLKQHPVVAKCANQKVQASQKQQKKEGLDPSTSSEEFGEFIQACNKQLPRKEASSKK